MTFIDICQEMLSYPFLVRALIVGLLVSVCASLLGVSLVLKRYAMIGDGLSHVGFGALAVVIALNTAPLAFTIPVVIIAAFLLLRITNNSQIKGDAAIAIISSSALAIGVMTISLTRGMNTDIYNFLFGSLLALSPTDARLSLICAPIILFVFILLYPRVFAVTFDETFARATGTQTGAYNMTLAVLTAVTIVLGMRMMGALLISSLIIFPPLTAMRVFKTFKSVVISSVIIATSAFLIGIFISYVKEISTGTSIVLVNLLVFLVFAIIGKGIQQGLKTKYSA